MEICNFLNPIPSIPIPPCDTGTHEFAHICMISHIRSAYYMRMTKFNAHKPHLHIYGHIQMDLHKPKQHGQWPSLIHIPI